MSESFRRECASPKAANSKRLDQRSDSKKLRYKISRKIPDPKGALAEEVHSPRAGHETLRDTQLGFGALADDRRLEAKPFLKWAGGKTQLLKQLDQFFPKKVGRYFEPFLGGGAVFFHLKHRFPKMEAFLFDINPELINAYKVVRDFPQELMQRLDTHLECLKGGGNSYFKSVRDQHHLPQTQTLERAARMIFLNKTCFNGLWRVNADGEFNAPLGRYKNYVLYKRENIEAASRMLKEVKPAEQDFRATLRRLGPGDFAYIDPPYMPISKTANFTGYAKSGFGLKEQEELAVLFAEAARRGARLMLSNSDVPIVRQLYRDFTVHTVLAKRSINSNAAKRGQVHELVIVSEGEG